MMKILIYCHPVVTCLKHIAYYLPPHIFPYFTIVNLPAYASYLTGISQNSTWCSPISPCFLNFMSSSGLYHAQITAQLIPISFICTAIASSISSNAPYLIFSRFTLMVNGNPIIIGKKKTKEKTLKKSQRNDDRSMNVSHIPINVKRHKTLSKGKSVIKILFFILFLSTSIFINC